MNDLKGVVVGLGATPWQMDLRGPQPSKWDEKKGKNYNPNDLTVLPLRKETHNKGFLSSSPR